MSEDVSARPATVPLRDLGTVETIETIRWKRQPNLLWARVHTSAGAVGLGETYYLPGAVERVIHDLAAELFIGQPAGAISKLWSDFFSCANFFGFAGAEMRALSALDVALWDALGQSAGLPLYQLLGGASRSAVPAYNTCVNAGLTPGLGPRSGRTGRAGSRAEGPRLPRDENLALGPVRASTPSAWVNGAGRLVGDGPGRELSDPGGPRHGVVNVRGSS